MVLAPLNVNFAFVPERTAAPESNAPTNAAENVTGLWPNALSSLIRREGPEIVGRTIIRTVLLLSAGLVSEEL
jgi:hypothetical protein